MFFSKIIFGFRHSFDYLLPLFRFYWLPLQRGSLISLTVSLSTSSPPPFLYIYIFCAWWKKTLETWTQFPSETRVKYNKLPQGALFHVSVVKMTIIIALFSYLVYLTSYTVEPWAVVDLNICFVFTFQRLIELIRTEL